MLYNDERTVVLIDGSNIFHQLKQVGLKIDWKGFRNYMYEYAKVIRIVYYTAVHEDKDTGHQSLRKLLDWLTFNGFDIREKEARSFTDLQGRTFRKGNVDVEIAVDIMRYATNARADNIILMSGDGDFSYALEHAKVNGARIGIIGIRKSGGVAEQLRKTADYMLDLQEMDVSWIMPVTETTSAPGQ